MFSVIRGLAVAAVPWIYEAPLGLFFLLWKRPSRWILGSAVNFAAV